MIPTHILDEKNKFLGLVWLGGCSVCLIVLNLYFMKAQKHFRSFIQIFINFKY